MAHSKCELRTRAALKSTAAIFSIGIGASAMIWVFWTLGASQNADDNFGNAIFNAAASYDPYNEKCQDKFYTLSNLPSDLLSPNCLTAAYLASCVFKAGMNPPSECAQPCNAMQAARDTCSRYNWNFFDVNNSAMPIATMIFGFGLGMVFFVCGCALAMQGAKQWKEARTAASADYAQMTT